MSSVNYDALLTRQLSQQVLNLQEDNPGVSSINSQGESGGEGDEKGYIENIMRDFSEVPPIGFHQMPAPVQFDDENEHTTISESNNLVLFDLDFELRNDTGLIPPYSTLSDLDGDENSNYPNNISREHFSMEIEQLMRDFEVQTEYEYNTHFDMERSNQYPIVDNFQDFSQLSNDNENRDHQQEVNEIASEASTNSTIEIGSSCNQESDVFIKREEPDIANAYAIEEDKNREYHNDSHKLLTDEEYISGSYMQTQGMFETESENDCFNDEQDLEDTDIKSPSTPNNSEANSDVSYLGYQLEDSDSDTEYSFTTVMMNSFEPDYSPLFSYSYKHCIFERNLSVPLLTLDENCFSKSCLKSQKFFKSLKHFILESDYPECEDDYLFYPLIIDVCTKKFDFDSLMKSTDEDENCVRYQLY